MIAFISIVTLLAILYASYLRGEINSLEGKVADLKIKVDLLEKRYGDLHYLTARDRIYKPQLEEIPLTTEECAEKPREKEQVKPTPKKEKKTTLTEADKRRIKGEMKSMRKDDEFLN